MKNRTAMAVVFAGVAILAAASLVSASGGDSLCTDGSFGCKAGEWGGAGGLSYRAAAFDMTPVVDLVKTDPKLAGIIFPSLQRGHQVIDVTGGFGYRCLENGIRIGAAWSGGSTKHVGRGSAADSAVSLEVYAGSGGLFIEKVVVRQHWNIHLGSIIGGGYVSLRKKDISYGTVFSISNDRVSGNGEYTIARLMSLELHGGATYSVFPWMHIGGDVSAMPYYSFRGFRQSINSGFSGIQPGFGMRLAFGNRG